MNVTTRGAIRTGEVLSYTQDEGGRGFVQPANPADWRQMPIGIATEPIPEGAELTWDVSKGEGYVDGRRVIVARMRFEDVHVITMPNA